MEVIGAEMLERGDAAGGRARSPRGRGRSGGADGLSVGILGVLSQAVFLRR